MTAIDCWTRLTTGPFAAPRRLSDGLDAHDLARCRDCELLGAKDELVQGVCPQCVRDSGRVVCDGCGRLLHASVAVVTREIGYSGRLMTWTYCPACQRENERG